MWPSLVHIKCVKFVLVVRSKYFMGPILIWNFGTYVSYGNLNIRVCHSRVGSSRGCLCDTIFHNNVNAFSYIIYFQAGRKWPSPRIIPITIKVSIPVWKVLVARLRGMAVIHVEDNCWAAWSRPLNEAITSIFRSDCLKDTSEQYEIPKYIEHLKLCS
jgi:hypothetical protein